MGFDVLLMHGAKPPTLRVVAALLPSETGVMRAVQTAEITRRRNELVRRVGQADDAAGVFAAASARLRRLVPFDAAVWMSTDPDTGLPTGPTRVDNLDPLTPEQCSEHWRREFIVEDVNRFAELTLADRPAAGLRVTVGDPARSSRFRRFLRPLGFDDELRAVLRAGDAPWGTLTMWRRDGRPAFDERDTEIISSLSSPIGEALRVRARPGDEPGGLLRYERPGMLIFDTAGELVSVDDQARAWLAELGPDPGVPTDLGLELPVWLLITMSRAAAVGDGVGDGTARARVRLARGSWLVCHASCLQGADGGFGNTVVVIEPANAAEIAPIIVEAYDLTEREQQITRLIARGFATSDIATELFLSAHTVRDHVKSIFQKVEVSSRGELVAKLYADHYEPLHLRHTRTTEAS